MGLGFRKRRSVEPPLLLAHAQAGDAEARNQLIADYTPFVLKIASQSSGRYLRPGIDEEISVALLAFNEAITAYDQSKGAFLSFAQTVIKRRLVDYYRRGRARQKEVLLSELEAPAEDGGAPTAVLDHLAESMWNLAQDEDNRRMEIAEYGSLLEVFGLSFHELVRVAPRHDDARQRAITIARTVAHHPEFREHLLKRHELPMQKLMHQGDYSRKTLERHRKYIIAVALILIHEFPYLEAYLLQPSRGVET